MVSFSYSIIKNFVEVSSFSRFSVKLFFFILILDQHLVLVVYLNLLLLTYNVLRNRDNLINNQLCNHPLDQLQFFECYHKFLNHFVLADQKKFLPLIITLIFWYDKTENLSTPWKLVQLNNLKIGLVSALSLYFDIYFS